MVLRRRLAVICSLALLAAVSSGAKKAGHRAAIDPDRAAAQLLELHNKERVAAGDGPLHLNDKLTAAAQDYAEFLAKNNKFSHTADGSPGSRIKEHGGHFHAYGENIAKGQPSPESAVNSWMHSDGHRKNILSKHYTQVGFGVARTEKGALVWVADFGG